MKVFIAIIALTLAVASQASYIPEVASYPIWPATSTSVWPPNGIYAQGAYNAWPHTTAAGWNAHPYVNSWSAPEWSPAASIYNNGLYGHKTVVQANVAKTAYPWGQSATSIYNNGLYGQNTVIQANVAKAAYPWRQSAASIYNNGLYGQNTVIQANVAKAAYPWGQSAASIYNQGLYGQNTVVQANVAKVAYPWGQPWGTYGAGAPVYGLGYNGGYLSSVPVSKQIAATPGSYHVAPVPVEGQNCP